MEPTAPPCRIVGTRTELRRHDPTLAARMFACVDQDRARLSRYLPWVDAVNSVADERSYIDDALSKWSAHEVFDFGIYRAGCGTYVGNIGVHTIAWSHDRCEIGYWILGRHEGQGLISDALRALEGVLFSMGFNRIEIRCNRDNQRSAQVPRRNAYVLDGILREDCVEQHGQYRDTMVFSKLAADVDDGSQPVRPGLAGGQEAAAKR